MRLLSSFKITELEITKSHLDDELSLRFWSILKTILKLTKLKLDDSLLKLPASAPTLPRIDTFSAKCLTSATFSCVLGRLSDLTHLEVHLKEANIDILSISNELLVSGHKLLSISLSCEHFPANRIVSEQRIVRLAEVIHSNTKRLKELELKFLTMSEPCQVSLLESCRKISTLQRIK